MPAWVQDGVQEYLKRFPREISVEIIDIPLGNRSKSSSPQIAIQQESKAILAQLEDKDFVIALEVGGRMVSTEYMAEHLDQWRMDGDRVVLLVGGPDGLSDSCRKRANTQWSLSRLTLPHPIVRVLLVEQLYRAWSITQNHPYHRA